MKKASPYKFKSLIHTNIFSYSSSREEARLQRHESCSDHYISVFLRESYGVGPDEEGPTSGFLGARFVLVPNTHFVGLSRIHCWSHICWAASNAWAAAS